MRAYDDPLEVYTGPEQEPRRFRWRGRWWQVSEVAAHWVETGAWWVRPPGRETATGTGTGAQACSSPVIETDLLREREVWRVSAAPVSAAQVRAAPVSAAGPVEDPGFGVFDLVFRWTEGDWRLTRSLD